ncbi:ankyrin repeat domain-containing protein 2-like [Haliotis rubra]|uniref:ankyrin repeat domain-containing protein 2-like n=1 Tax=Haliotis rubra TaxID=36100 RepID=UPI001EE5CC15|nr:ankyrin repeat domain-containing protein 2-like [Haliotis rubra]
MAAALEGHREVVELLLSRGADVSLVDEDGNNILHYACMGGDVGTVELILSLDVVDVNARNNDGETAADRARVEGHHQLADLVSRAAR